MTGRREGGRSAGHDRRSDSRVGGPSGHGGVQPGERITSLTNPRVKAIRALDMRKERKATGLFVAEGAALLVSAMEAGWSAKTLVHLAGAQGEGANGRLIAWAQAAGAEILAVSPAVQAKLASKENPQAALAVFEQRFAALPEAARVPEDATWLALEEVRDPGNLGTIIRTVDAVGAAGILLVGTCCDPYSRECVRATMGSIFSVPLVRVSRDDFLAWRQGWRGDVVGLHLKGADDFRRAVYRGPQLVVMGSEGPGLSEAVADACSLRVKIPMAGRLDSLNLAVATALTLYQVRSAYLKL